MTNWLSIGVLFILALIFFVLFKWGAVRCVGVTPVKSISFIAILFTSGLDVGLIMFPLTEFPVYADLVNNPEYAFSNPLAIEFGFWGFLVWGMYFLTCFYFCVLEPHVKFFEIPLVKLLNNIIIVGTCAFTASLFLNNLPWYLPQLGDGKSVGVGFYVLVFLVIAAAVHSSSNLRYVRWLSLGSTVLFLALIVFMGSDFAVNTDNGMAIMFQNFLLVSDYFKQLDKFVLPINSYHEFYLYWWFAWSIMIGQFTARFVGGFKTWQLLLAMMIVPSVLIAIWFTVLYSLFSQGSQLGSIIPILMVCVGVVFVINSLDSLIRLYTDNLSLKLHRFGYARYFFGNLLALVVLTMLFQLNFLKIEWVGALVIALLFGCFFYILVSRRARVWQIKGSPEQNRLDFEKLARTV
ncbi:BCCT family transporter [Arenicella sp. 4NH20-0111]|uniref:BCCT family transporter n=1 Tax=Arenicella sp. 4NH20-0111 TaxID=3127648 RepID=UPI00310A8037